MSAIQQESKGALERIKAKNQGLVKELEQAPGYAIFPSVGRAGTVLGGAYGHGMVYERGEPIGEASIGQMTIGVQVGGQTFSEIVIFRSQEALDRFKRGRISFNANASADVVKAAASGTADYEKDVEAKTYSQGGMLIELSLGVQGFRFKPKETLGRHGAGDGDSSESEEKEEGESEKKDEE